MYTSDSTNSFNKQLATIAALYQYSLDYLKHKLINSDWLSALRANYNLVIVHKLITLMRCFSRYKQNSFNNNPYNNIQIIMTSSGKVDCHKALTSRCLTSTFHNWALQSLRSCHHTRVLLSFCFFRCVFQATSLCQ